MEYFKKVFKESIAIVVISSIMGLFSGILLTFNQKFLFMIPIILLIIPALNSLIGDISTVLVSRLTSHLYIGDLPPKIQNSKRLREDFVGLFITILLSLLVLLFLSYLIAFTMGIHVVNPFIIIFILFLTISILFIILFCFLFISSIIIFRKGGDPNNYLIPLTTSLCDFLTPLLLIVFLILFL